MKRAVICGLALLAGCLKQDIEHAEPVGAVENDPANMARVKCYLVVGDMRVRSGGGAWRPGARGMNLLAGDEVAIGANSRAVFVFSNGARVVVSPDTEFAITRLQQWMFDQARQGTFLRLKRDPSRSLTTLELRRGTLAGDVQELNRRAGSSFLVQTPAGAADVHGGYFSVRVQPGGPDVGTTQVTAGCCVGAMTFTATARPAPHGFGSLFGSRLTNIPAGTELEVVAQTVPGGPPASVNAFPLRCFPQPQEVIDRIVSAVNQTIDEAFSITNPGNPIPNIVPPTAVPCPLTVPMPGAPPGK